MQRDIASLGKVNMSLWNAFVGERRFHRSEELELHTQLERMKASDEQLRTQLKVERDLREAVEAASREEIFRLKQTNTQAVEELAKARQEVSKVMRESINVRKELAQERAEFLLEKKRFSSERESSQRVWTRQLLSQIPLLGTMKDGIFGFPKDHPKFVALRDLFINSLTKHRYSHSSSEWCKAPQLHVTRIMEVRNANLQKLFETERSHNVLPRNERGCTPIPHITAFKCFVEAGAVDLNEYLLFHGCPLHSVDAIAKQGLDPQRGGEANGASFGKGTYFAQNASKCHLYTTCGLCSSDAKLGDCTHDTGERSVLVARVLLGEAKVSTAKARPATTTINGVPYGQPRLTTDTST